MSPFRVFRGAFGAPSPVSRLATYKQNAPGLLQTRTRAHFNAHHIMNGTHQSRVWCRGLCGVKQTVRPTTGKGCPGSVELGSQRKNDAQSGQNKQRQKLNDGSFIDSPKVEVRNSNRHQRKEKAVVDQTVTEESRAAQLWADGLRKSTNIQDAINRYNQLVSPDALATLDASLVDKGLQRLVRRATVEDMPKLIRWFSKIRKTRPELVDVEVYTGMITRCHDLKRADLTWDIFGEMRFNNMEMNSQVYGLMMNSCALKRESERALELFMEMQEKQVPLCEHTFATLIRATSVRADMHQRTFELMALYLASGHLPSERLMCNVLYSCAQVGNVRSAHQIWNRLSDKDPYNLYAMQPSRRMYTQLLKVYTKAIRDEAPLALARATSAEHIYLTYKDVGRLVMQDAGDLGKLSELAAEDKRIKDAQDLMESENTQATASTEVSDPSTTQLSLNPKPNVASLLKYVDSAVSRMKADGSGHDIYSVNALVEAYSWSYQLDKAVDLLKNLEGLTGVKPNTECYRAVISCAVVLKRMNTAFDLYEEYVAKEIAPVPFGQDPYAENAWSKVKFGSAHRKHVVSNTATDTTGLSTTTTDTPTTDTPTNNTPTNATPGQLQKQSAAEERCTPGYLKMHLTLINGCAEAGAFGKGVEIVQHLCNNRGTPKPNYMMKFRKLAFEKDATEFWDQAKALCLKHDLDNEWAVTDIRYKDAFKKWKPPKLKFYDKRQQMPGHHSDLAYELNPTDTTDPNIAPRRHRQKLERKANAHLNTGPILQREDRAPRTPYANRTRRSGGKGQGNRTTALSAKEQKKRNAAMTAYERTMR